MLSFDRHADRFLYDDVPIGRNTTAQQLAGRLPGVLADMPGQPGWQSFETKDRPINLFAAMRNGLLHSGYFWATVSSGGSWDDLEPTEARRRAEHEAIMRSLFEADRHDGPALTVSLVRDPRDSLERIMFEVKA